MKAKQFTSINELKKSIPNFTELSEFYKNLDIKQLPSLERCLKEPAYAYFVKNGCLSGEHTYNMVLNPGTYSMFSPLMLSFLECNLHVMEKINHVKGNILVIACGFPWVILKGQKAIGIDLVDPKVNNSNFTFVKGNVDNVTTIFKGKKFDTILCLGYSMYVKSYSKLMKDLSILLSDDGYLYMHLLRGDGGLKDEKFKQWMNWQMERINYCKNIKFQAFMPTTEQAKAPVEGMTCVDTFNGTLNLHIVKVYAKN